MARSLATGDAAAGRGQPALPDFCNGWLPGSSAKFRPVKMLTRRGFSGKLFEPSLDLQQINCRAQNGGSIRPILAPKIDQGAVGIAPN
jgi:hypothetical protein